MSQEMSIFKVRNKKTHNTNASARSDSETAMFAIMNVIKGIDALRTQEPLQQQVLAAAGVPASVGMSLFHDPQSF